MSVKKQAGVLLPTIKVLGGVVAFTGVVLACWLYGQNFDPERSGKYREENRDYSLLPFDMLDAQNICRIKTKLRYGDVLVRSLIDDHSTRYESSSGLYKVFMFAHLGSAQVYDEANIHCFVNPDEYMVEHYRVFQSKQKSIMDRAISLLNG